MPAYWTADGSDKVVKQHFQPKQVDTSDADFVTDKKRPQRPDVKPWVQTQLHYNDKRGLYYVTENPFKGLNLTNAEKRKVYEAIERRDLVKAREVIEAALRK